MARSRQGATTMKYLEYLEEEQCSLAGARQARADPFMVEAV